MPIRRRCRRIGDRGSAIARGAGKVPVYGMDPWGGHDGRVRTRIPVLVGVLALTLGITACGTGGTASTPSQAPDSQASPASGSEKSGSADGRVVAGANSGGVSAVVVQA